ncbi:MAG: small, acid-soluble spore protein, alpha/beta type [Chloroflexota bacterium]
MSERKTRVAKPTKAAAAPKKPKEKPDTPMERLKLLIAGELGLLDKVRSDGWGGLSSAESGRVGGLMAKRMRDEPDILDRLWAARPPRAAKAAR